LLRVPDDDLRDIESLLVEVTARLPEPEAASYTRADLMRDLLVEGLRARRKRQKTR
jgi:hypothetical protein